MDFGLVCSQGSTKYFVGKRREGNESNVCTVDVPHVQVR